MVRLHTLVIKGQRFKIDTKGNGERKREAMYKWGQVYDKYTLVKLDSYTKVRTSACSKEKHWWMSKKRVLFLSNNRTPKIYIMSKRAHC